MSVYRYVRLDVFSNQPFTGIQLAVFPEAAGIDERRMQVIANEMALPETTFVFPTEAPQLQACADGECSEDDACREMQNPLEPSMRVHEWSTGQAPFEKCVGCPPSDDDGN